MPVPHVQGQDDYGEAWASPSRPSTTLLGSLAGNGHALVATCPPCSVNGEQDGGR